MDSNSRDPPVFSTDPSSLTPDTSLPSFGSPRAGTRAVTRVNFTDRRLSDVALDDDKHCIPTTATHSLFDSLTIDLDLHTPAVISISRTTISQRHEGLTEAYPRIRRIMLHVRKLLKETDSNATAKIAYILVCPNDGS